MKSRPTLDQRMITNKTRVNEHLSTLYHISGICQARF